MTNMKKLFLYILALFSVITVSSCSDKDEALQGTDREFMTMFICDNNRGKGDDYAYNSSYVGEHGNDIHLYWYGVKDCAGYEIRQALQPNVSGGAEAWESTAAEGKLLLDTIVGPDVLDLLIKDQQYATSYRFAIRVLSPKDNNTTDFSHASKWYGHGNGRQWAEYLGIDTKERYATPFVVYVDNSKTTETTMRVMINRDWNVVTDGVTEDDQETYKKEFEINSATNQFVYQWLEVEPSQSNPDATLNSKWAHYKLTEEDFERGYIDIDGLQKNSVYTINVRNENVPTKWDSYYNTCSARSDGEPGDPILIKHQVATTEPARLATEDDEDYAKVLSQHQAAVSTYDAMQIDDILTDFISNSELAEGQEFYLEGGKTYCMYRNLGTCKGFVLRTNPEDVAKGLRAKVLLGGLSMTGTDVNTMNLMFGRSPNPGEGGEIYMKMLEFYDIDFDCPLALTYGDNAAGVGGKVTGNYFINMYSDGMAVTLDKFVISNCTFHNLIRGFIREQGKNYKVWNHVLIENNQFYGCGYYNNGAGGFPWIAGSGSNAKSNLYNDFVIRNNTFFDSPFPSLFCETKQKNWNNGTWNITVENNTFVNFNTRGGQGLFNMRYLADGSVFTVKNNLFILTKQDGDSRSMNSIGADIRNTQTLSDGTAGHVTLNFENNYATNANLTKGSIFSSGAWSATKNNFGQLVSKKTATLNGSLDVIVDDITPNELMVSPNPPHKASTDTDQYMHSCTAIDGTGGSNGADLHYNNSAKVQNSKIYQLNIGDPRWRTNQ